MAYCKNCGNKVDDGAKFCPECGAEIKDNGARFCAKCGNERKGTEKFCSQCGTPYGQSPTSNVLEKKVRQGKSSKKLILIAAIAVVIALIGGAAWYFLGNQNRYSLEGLAKAAVNYDGISEFHEGLARVFKDGKYGFIDKMGNEVIPCIYDDYMEDAESGFHDGLAFVWQGDKHFFINKEGKEAFSYNYDSGLNFSEGLALVRKGRKCGYIDTNGDEVIPLTDKYYGSSFHDGLAAVSNNDGKLGFIDKKGQLVIPYTFDAVNELGNASEFHEGLAIVYKNEKPSCIDKSGKELSIGNYSFIHDFNDGMAVVNKNNKYGFIDVNGKEVIPCAYERATSFSEGYAFVKKDGKYMQIDKSGKVLNTFNYEVIFDFHDGLALVSNRSGNKSLIGYIDTNGNEVIPCVYTNFNDFSEGLAAVIKDGVCGFVDKNGNSTFDIQDEDVKRVVQAKIDEKEKIRKQEEERRAEEERKRIEEENKPCNVFYKIAQSGNYVWEFQFHKENTVFGLAKENSMTFYFYPDSPTSGQLSYIECSWKKETPETYFWSAASAHYTITDSNVIIATLVGKSGQTFYLKNGMTISLKIKKEGDRVSLKEVDGLQDCIYTQIVKVKKDFLR